MALTLGDLNGDDDDAAGLDTGKPFWTLDFDDDEAVKDWLVRTFDALRLNSREAAERQRRDLAAYRGIHVTNNSRSTVSSPEERELPRNPKNPQVVVNHTRDAVEQHVSRMTKFKPDIAAEPASKDYNDVINAKTADEILEAAWYKRDIDAEFRALNRGARIFGDMYLFCLWDEHLGPYHPDWVAETFKKNDIKGDPKKMSKGEIRRIFREEIKEIPRIPLNIQDDNGNPLFIDKPLRVGDICHKIKLPWFTFPQVRSEWDDVEFIFYVDFELPDDVKADHPDKADDIKMKGSIDLWESYQQESEHSRKGIEVIHFYHKSTRRLDQGRWIKFTRDVILENKPNPYEGPDGKIQPVLRLTDLDSPGKQGGDSTVTDIRPMQQLINNATSMNARSVFLTSHPKWFVPQNSVNKQSLSNQASLVTYKGPQPPMLQQAQGPGAGMFQWKQWLSDQFDKISGIFGVSRGEPPAGIKAGIALQFLEGQEEERANSSIAKHNKAIQKVALMDMSMMAQFYDESDGRLQDLLGKSRAAELESFKFADLADITDVRIRTSSALPRQKAARVQSIMDLSERFPEVFPSEQVMDMLELGDIDRFVSIATAAVRAAEMENDAFMRGDSSHDAKEWEDHLLHYKVHVAFMNDVSFKANFTEAMQQNLLDHMETHEMLMLEIIKTNPMYLELIRQVLPNFPIVTQVDPEVAAILNPMPMMPPGEGGNPGQPLPEGMMEMGTEMAPGMNEAMPGNEVTDNPLGIVAAAGDPVQ